MSHLKTCPQCGAEYELDQRFCPKDGATLRTPGGDHDLVGSVIADRYRVLRKLGEGGMGRVYLAEHVRMGRKSAVKVMNPGLGHDADAITRFNREASNASRISHPHVAAVYDFGETSDGLIYLAMEFVDGPSLTTLIARHGALPPLRAAAIVRQAADALAAAHDMGIVHRDLKPDNILVAKTPDGSDLVKVVDFGIAKAAGNDAQKVTRTGFVIGTPEYMSPEQLAGDPLDGRSDIYSLGLVAFHMLTGALPFRGESAQQAMLVRLTDRPSRLPEMKPDVAWPADVQAVLDKALERDANRRYQTAPEFGRDLYRAVSAMPLSLAAEASTQVIGAATTRTAAVPATRVTAAASIAPARPAPAATPAGKSKTPLIAAIATVVALGGVMTVMLQMRKPANAAPAPRQASGAAADSTEHGNGASPQNANAERDAAGRAANKPIGPPALKPGANQAGPPAASAADVDAELTRLDSLVTDSNFDKPAAQRVLQALDTLSGRLATPVQNVSAAIIRAAALGSVGLNDSGCAILRGIKDKASTASQDSTVRSIMLHISCN
ncbi:MAG: serine/threonine-protein kinase [Gemmatimonadaceae bacterium]|nr:serine/threonine-protein kinase [Gemmatimonadaceae bacterium]